MVRWTPEQYAKFARGHAKVSEALRKPHPRPSSKTGPKAKARVSAYACAKCGVHQKGAVVERIFTGAGGGEKITRFKCACGKWHQRIGKGAWKCLD